MHIERTHNIIEKLSEVIENEFANGAECIDTCEMGAVADIYKDLNEAEYYATLVKSMNEASTDEVMAMFDRYGDRRYYTDRERRERDEPPYYHYPRDIDRLSGRMYYSEPIEKTEKIIEKSESEYDKAKRHYTETKELHKGNTPEDKESKMKSLDGYIRELSGDITQLIGDMTAEEKNLLRNKMSTLVSKI